MRSTLAALASYAERACGRIPHEITTNGRVFHPGNTQETPQFAAACWDYARWSGDLGFLAQVYPLCVEGLEHFAATIEGRDYPHGDGVVERIGMGAHKLDSVCYLYQALVALDEAATTLGRPTDAERFRSQATQLRARFERDWWIEHEGLYADSLQLNKQPQLDGHWTVVLPIQLGLAAPERAERALGRIEREWVNQWGLVHTRGAEAHVWTLPTGLLALAAFAYDRSALGVTLLRNIAITGSHGTLGTLKELIPQGICFIQLWSAGLLVQGLTEGLLGLQPRAYAHSLAIKPNLPADWPEVTLRGLQVGGHTLDLHVSQTEIIVLHRNGPIPITIEYAHKTLSVDVGQRVVVNGS
jgi:glycogen debranching enzyme